MKILIILLSLENFMGIFFLFVIFTIFLNVKLQIYQRGLIPNINIFLISGIVKWLFIIWSHFFWIFDYFSLK